ncbi:uncharacterized protein [Temnothorax longispinosus]|uniref:uncharacterized protein n=1 Tax=Temnothorax longispinosus TaxID=300112 RepID=UPI003A9A5012
MSAGDDPPFPVSPNYEEIRDDFQSFLSQSEKSNQATTENVMDVVEETRKRPLPISSTEDEEDATESGSNVKSNKKRQGNPNTSGSSPKKAGKQSQATSVQPKMKTDNKGNSNLSNSNQGNKPGASEIPAIYGAYTKAPFIVLFRMPTAKDQPRRRISILTMAKKLMSANVKYESVAPFSFNTWKVTFPSKAASNAALKNKYIKEAGFLTYIPKYKLTRQFVIRSIPLDFSLTDLKNTIEDENQDILILDLFRLKRRDRTTGIWSDSQAVCIQKMGEDLPDHIKIFKTIVHTSPFQRSVRLCFNCGLFGHLAKFCEKNPRCLQYGSEDHTSSKEAPCIKPKKCINCEEEHATSDRKCPKYLKNLEISKVMAADNLPFMEARALVQKREKGCPFENFPPLPSKGGIQMSNIPASLQSSPRGRSFAASLTHCAPEISSRLLEIMERASAMKQVDVLLNRLENTLKLHEGTTKE